MWRTVGVLSLMTLGISLDEPSKAKGWRDIQPLHSTRADVERLLGPPTDKRDCIYNICTYYLHDVNVQFNYSPGDCKSGRGAWDVPPDTVVNITVHSGPGLRWSSLA